MSGRPTRQAAEKANERIEIYAYYTRLDSDHVKTPIDPRDKEYKKAIDAQIKHNGVNGGFVKGSGYHYDRGYKK